MLELRHVTMLFRRGGLFDRGPTVRAVDDVSLVVGDGEAFGLVGRSGSGKTTLGMIMCGALRPTAGDVRPTGDRRALRSQAIFQDPRDSLDPRMRVRDIVAEPLAVRRPPPPRIPAEVVRTLARVQLGEELCERFPHELSGGQRQRVSIARALIGRPDLIVADEPTSMLDATAAVEIISLLKGLKEEGRMSFVFITHDLAQAAVLCDRMGVMADGALVEVGEPRRLCVAPRGAEAQALLEAARSRQNALARF
jgi:ABC-type glutathione transport system ATPase component